MLTIEIGLIDKPCEKIIVLFSSFRPDIQVTHDRSKSLKLDESGPI